MAVKKKVEYPKIKIKLVKSLIGRSDRQQATVKGLGLRKINSRSHPREEAGNTRHDPKDRFHAPGRGGRQ